MSNKALIWAKEAGMLNREILSASEIFTLWMIGDHYNEEQRRAFPSYARLCRYSGMSRSTIMRAVRALADCGLIEVEPWFSENRQQQNRYYLPYYDKRSHAHKGPVFAGDASEWDRGFDEDGNEI
jgi:DNA-binding transcriptional ArsR family regulator